MQRRRGIDEKEVIRQEREQSKIYKNKTGIIRQQLKAEEIERYQKRLQEQRAKKRYRVGKQPMVRSAKMAMQKKEKKKEIDPDQVANQQYLGYDMAAQLEPYAQKQQQ